MFKREYLQQPEVAGFVDWLAVDCNTRPFALNILRSPYVETAVNADVTGVEGLLENYHWKSSWDHPVSGAKIRSADWNSTQTIIGQLADGARNAMHAQNEDQCLQWCLCILKWGGVRGAIPFLRSLHSTQQLATYLNSIQPLLRLDTDSDDAAITSTNIKRFDAGLTKIHAFIDTTGSPIYDSRVGAAISMFAAIYTEDVNPDHVTDLLVFPAGDARGNQYRNPADSGYRPAPKFYTTAVSRDHWARSQLRLGWILQAVIQRNNSLFDQFDTPVEKIQALQGALFMAGYDLRCFNTHDRAGAAPSRVIPPPDPRPALVFEPFGKVVPTGFTMRKVADLLNDYQSANADNPQPLTRQRFIEWQTQRAGIGNPKTAAANCFPLMDSEFAIYDRTAEEIVLFCNGGYNSLLNLTGYITPSWDEREYVCLIDVFLAGRLQELFNNPRARTQILTDQGFAGTLASANTLLNVGRSVGRHFELINPDNTPTVQFQEYFSAPKWNNLLP